MWLLQFDNNGGLCPFFWQDFRNYSRVDIAERCRLKGGKPRDRFDTEGLLGQLGETVPEGVDNQLQTVRNLEF
jgi:hypothetical protein